MALQSTVSLVSEQANDCSGRAFSRALIDTLKLDKIQASLAKDATELLREIDSYLRPTSV